MDEEMRARLYILIGERIKKYRGKVSQEKLAKGIKLNRTSITNMEKGRQHPTIDTLWSIATFLKVDPQVLLPSIEETKLAFDDIYLKQLSLPQQKWAKQIIEDGEDNK